VKRLPRWVIALALAALALLYLPLAGVVWQSFNASRLGLDWKGFTLQWYARLLENTDIHEAARNTIIVAGVSTVIATGLGTALAIGLARFPWSRRAASTVENLLYLPVIAPEIVMAAALVILFMLLHRLHAGFDFGLPAVIVGHVTFQIPFVALTVRSRIIGLPRNIDEAACDLYSTGWNRFRRVTLPLLAPGVAAGALLAFILSLDDFVITFFAAGPRSETLPLLIYSSQRRGITPEIHALSTLILVFTVMAVMVGTRVLRSRETTH
jgi:spermidine/putrescine transport system permease protein